MAPVRLTALALSVAAGLSLGVGASQARAGSSLPPLTADEVFYRHRAKVMDYPQEALKAGVEGHATVVCTVQGSGTLAECQITEETPGGYGFAAKTLEMAQSIRVYGLSRYGADTRGRLIAIPMRFRLPPTS